MSLAWESEENKTNKKVRQQKPHITRNEDTKTKCPYCNNEMYSSKDKNIRCSKCKKWFHRGQKSTLTIQEIPTVLIRQSIIDIGRFCKCGCGKKISQNARIDKVFFSGRCRASYQGQIMGFRDSRYVLRSSVRIRDPRQITIYPKIGEKITILITKDQKKLWEFCEKIEADRSRELNSKDLLQELKRMVTKQ